jgi:hypothetical protein
MTDFPETTAKRQRLLRRPAAALYITENYFPCAAKTLAKLACIGSTGPAFRRVGRVPLYQQSILDEWARGKIGPLQRSTSDLSERTPSRCVREQSCRVDRDRTALPIRNPDGVHTETRDVRPQQRFAGRLHAGRDRTKPTAVRGRPLAVYRKRPTPRR